MIIVESIITDLITQRSLKHDVVQLAWENRQKCRQRLKTRAGTEIGLALPTGTILFPGDILYRDPAVEVVVEGVPEKVFNLRLGTREQFGLACYQIGNLHRPIGLHDGAVLVPYEPVLEGQLTRLGFDYTIEEQIFTHAVRQPGAHVHVH